jgi:hypothetical protein
MNKRKPAVFISHAGPDYKFAEELKDALSKVGIDAHLDQVELRVGDNIIRWMNDAASESDYMIVLLSPNSLGRYWVETEWSSALMKEADLRRTFVLPAILPGVKDGDIPFLLRAKAYIDFRVDVEGGLMKLINRIKQDMQVARDLARLPSPAPHEAQEQVLSKTEKDDELIEVIVHSNRFGRNFRFIVPSTATPSYIISLLRSTFNLKWNNIDEDLLVELSYTYSLRWRGNGLSLHTPLCELGIPNGTRLELWIQVTLTDLLEGKKVSREEIHFCLSQFNIERDLDKTTQRLLMLKDRSFTSAQIAQIAKKYFSHVDS